MTKHKIFIGAPTFIISKGVILEGSYAMAFGGVDTGNMKENDVVNVGGNINNKGLMDSDTHTRGVMIGNNMLAVALLEATCVSSMAMEQIISWRTKESKSVRPANCCPIQSFKPRKKKMRYGRYNPSLRNVGSTRRGAKRGHQSAFESSLFFYVTYLTSCSLYPERNLRQAKG